MDLRRAVYTKEFEYENLDGTKGTIRLLPLNMSYLPFLISLSRKFKEGMTQEQILQALDEETVKGIVDICLASIKRSAPGMPEDDANDFIIQHWTTLFPVIVELNSSRQKV
jgi:hypothetical protein